MRFGFSEGDTALTVALKRVLPPAKPGIRRKCHVLKDNLQWGMPASWNGFEGIIRQLLVSGANPNVHLDRFHPLRNAHAMFMYCQSCCS